MSKGHISSIECGSTEQVKDLVGVIDGNFMEVEVVQAYTKNNDDITFIVGGISPVEQNASVEGSKRNGKI